MLGKSEVAKILRDKDHRRASAMEWAVGSGTHCWDVFETFWGRFWDHRMGLGWMQKILLLLLCALREETIEARCDWCGTPLTLTPEEVVHLAEKDRQWHYAMGYFIGRMHSEWF